MCFCQSVRVRGGVVTRTGPALAVREMAPPPRQDRARETNAGATRRAGARKHALLTPFCAGAWRRFGGRRRVDTDRAMFEGHISPSSVSTVGFRRCPGAAGCVVSRRAFDPRGPPRTLFFSASTAKNALPRGAIRAGLAASRGRGLPATRRGDRARRRGAHSLRRSARILTPRKTPKIGAIRGLHARHTSES